MKKTTRKIDGRTIKITSAGYLYVDGEKITNRRISPLYVPKIGNEEIEAFVRSWAHQNWEMVNA